MPDPTTDGTLKRLSDADYEVAPNEPDIRGWSVMINDDDAVGEVDDLIIDPAAGKVRYLDVDLDTDALGLDNDRHAYIPIAQAQLDHDDEVVVLGGFTRESLLRLPQDDPTRLEARSDARSEARTDATTAGAASSRVTNTSSSTSTPAASGSKRITRSAEELKIGKRMEKAGEVRVSKHVETEHVRQSVPITREEVRVERRPVERAVGAAPEMGSDEITVPVMEEQVIVEKRPVVKEEVVISKAPVTAEQTVEADVRREKIDVNPSSRDVRVNDDLKGRGGE